MSKRASYGWSCGFSFRLRRLIGPVLWTAAALVSFAPVQGRGQGTGGDLRILGPDGAPAASCPLKHTEVEADIAGFMGRVRVRQVFENPLPDKIEAVYVFPLPSDAAVDEMTMTVGDRTIVGEIKPRDEARRIYDDARAAGHVTSLLDQERPNVFTQSVANIEPGARVEIEIGYVETLAYDDGWFEFVFPMVVGPRYVPGAPTGRRGTGWAPDTTEVPDGSRISPPVERPGTRAGHEVDLRVEIDAGAQILDLESVLHDVDVHRHGAERATIELAKRGEIPNRDFVLRYRTATDRIGDAMFVHTDPRGTFFTLVLQPPRRVAPEQAVPKEMIFVIDRSGSMSGFPIEKAKKTMRLAIEAMNPNDTFNLLSFAGGTGRCFDHPVAATAANRAAALKYLEDLHGSGGTEMMPAILEALSGPFDPRRVRIVAFMTDGYIGNDFAIIDAVEKHAGTTRVFSFGIGNSVNRFLLDAMARAGRGAVEYVTLASEGDAAAERFHERVRSPVLTDIEIDWGTLPVEETYPQRVPDLFSRQPIVVHGRLERPARGTITLHGNTAAGPYEDRIEVDAGAPSDDGDGIASLWARAKVADLMAQDFAALQRGSFVDEVRREITSLGVDYRLMTQFTSFVAVEEVRVTIGGEPRTVAVPVEIPAGVDYEGVFGRREEAQRALAAPPAAALVGSGLAFRNGAEVGAVEDEARERLRDEAGGGKAAGKLSGQLAGLAERVERDGKEGDLDAGSFVVEDNRVDVIVYLRETSEETLEALRKIGFVRGGESSAADVLIGRIDVRKLEELAKQPMVLRVTPVPGPTSASPRSPSSRARVVQRVP